MLMGKLKPTRAQRPDKPAKIKVDEASPFAALAALTAPAQPAVKPRRRRQRGGGR